MKFRNIAENAPGDIDSQGEPDANLNLMHHAATDEVSVEVIGRLYDFEITDIADTYRELVFRRRLGAASRQGLRIGSGCWISTAILEEIAACTPHRSVRGSHPLQGYQNTAVKTGYHFKFDFKTKGNMFAASDGIRITPSFTYVQKQGGSGTPVDLYYSTNSRRFIRIGSDEDRVDRYVILNQRLRNVPAEELEDTAGL